MRKVNGLRDDITRCIHFGSKILSSFKINRDRKLYMINYYAQRQNTCTLSQTNFVVSPPPPPHSARPTLITRQNQYAMCVPNLFRRIYEIF